METIFGELIKDHYNFNKPLSFDPKTIAIYPISEHNLEGIKILLDNCKKMGHNTDNINVRLATVDPTLWMGSFLDKHLDKISFVSTLLEFNILKIDNNKLISKSYRTEKIEFDDEKKMDDYFNERKFKTLSIFSIVKYVNLEKMKPYFSVHLVDITEKQEERDSKIKEILK